MNLILKIILTLIISNSAIAESRYLIEPLYGSMAGEWGDANKLERKQYFQGTLLGARLGLQTNGFQIGGEYNYTETKLKVSPEKLNLKEHAVFMGFESIGGMLRVYASYMFNIKATRENIIYEKGRGFKLGAGFQPFSFLALNVDFRRGDFFKQEDSNLNEETKVKKYFKAFSFTASLPIRF